MAERFDTDGALITGSVAARICQFTSRRRTRKESAGQHQIEQATVNHTSNRLKVELTTSPRLGEIRDGDDPETRGVLDEVDELTRERWQRRLKAWGRMT